jgi:hypothetical protein
MDAEVTASGEPLRIDREWGFRVGYLRFRIQGEGFRG